MFLDLDSGDDVEERVAFIQKIKDSSGGPSPLRVAIGCWVAKGFLHSAAAQGLLLDLGCYQVVPSAKRNAHLPLALWMVSYFHRNLPEDMCAMPGIDLFMYKAQQAMLIFTMHYTLEEQIRVFDLLTKYKKFHD